MRQIINKRLILIYCIIALSVIQDAVDFQMSMFITYPPTYNCSVNRSIYNVSVDQCSYTDISTGTYHSCSNWKFDQSQIQSTLVTELQLICDNRYWQLIIVPLRNLASLPILFVGFFADYWGRKKVFITLIFLDSFFWFLLSFLPTTYSIFVVFRVLKSSIKGFTNVGFVLVNELTPKKYRNIVAMNYWIFYGVGLVLAPGFMKATANWKSAYQLSMILNLVYLASPWVLLESPKWLSVNNRCDQAKLVLQILHQYSSNDEENIEEVSNRRETITEMEITNQSEIDLTSSHIRSSVMHNKFKLELKKFFRQPVLVLRLFVLFFCSVSFNLVYQGVATKLEFAFSDIYINVVILGLAEIPAGPLSAWIITKRSPMIISAALGIIFYISSPILWSPELKATILGSISHAILTTLSKFLLIGSWNILGFYFVLLIPTNLRNFAVNLTGLAGIIGGAIGGFVGYYYVDTYNSHYGVVANVIYLILLIASLVLMGFFIPSISANDKHALPDTVEEALLIRNEYNLTKYFLNCPKYRRKTTRPYQTMT